MSQPNPISLSSLRAVIYDMDGLILDTEPYWRQAEIEIFGSVGITLDDNACRQTMGMRIDEVVSYWFERYPWSGKTLAQVADDCVARVGDLACAKAALLPGVHDTLKYFTKHQLPIALASSSRLALIERLLRHFELIDLFQVIVSAEHDAYGKPHPAVFLRTADTLQVDPTRCLVLEDSFHGLIAAKAAKMFCAVVPELAHFDDPRFFAADLRIRSLADLPSRIHS